MMDRAPNIKEGTYLGFDFGTRYVGVAVGQSITRNARPLTSLQTVQKQHHQHIRELIQTWQPVGLVVGLPLNMDGSPQKLTELARAFGRSLQALTELPVYFHDERLSTCAARDQLFASEGYKGLRKDKVDAVSAQLILEAWLQDHQGNRDD